MKTKPLPYKLTENSRNVHTLRFEGIKPGWEAWFLLRTDAHHDNPHTDQALELKHLKQAVERDAGIICNGDSFCAMGGKWDKRSNKEGVRPEHQTGDYLDKLVKTAGDFYAPYARNWVVLGEGNHETAIYKRHETNLTERLAERMSTISGHKVHTGGYSGWVRFMFNMHGERRDSRKLYRHHGFGGGGPVTRGVIQTNRMAVYLPDADLVFTGHTHDEWVVPITRLRLSATGDQYKDEQIHVRGPSYKDAHGDGFGGWETERGMQPKTTGAVWLRFSFDGEIRTEVTRAQ